MVFFNFSLTGTPDLGDIAASLLSRLNHVRQNMGQKLSPQDLALYRAVDEVLHYIWDPIGVSGIPEARDEYQSYLPLVFKRVREGQSEETIADFLGTIATERMGLSMRKEHDVEVAQLLLNWQRVIHEQFA